MRLQERRGLKRPGEFLAWEISFSDQSQHPISSTAPIPRPFPTGERRKNEAKQRTRSAKYVATRGEGEKRDDEGWAGESSARGPRLNLVAARAPYETYQRRESHRVWLGALATPLNIGEYVWVTVGTMH